MKGPLKTPTPTELKNRKVARKSLCYSRGFEKGRQLKEEDFIALRPEGGISPMLIDAFIGKSLKQSVAQHTAVNLNHFL